MQKKKPPFIVRFLLGILSFVLCIALFVTTLATILVADLSLLTSKGGIQQLVKDILVPSSAPVHISAAIMPGRQPVKLDPTSDLTQGALLDSLYDMLKEQFGDELPIEKEQVQELLEQSTVPDFLADKVSGIVTDVISGELTTTITPEEVVELLEENKELIEETFEIEITDEIKDNVTQWVEENDVMDTVQQEVSEIIGITPPTPVDPSNPNGTVGGDGVLDNPNVNAGMELIAGLLKGEVTELGLAEALTILRFVTSKAVLLACIGACLLLCALLFLTNWGRPQKALRNCGYPIFLAGSFFITPTIVAYAMPELFAQFGAIGTAIRQVLTLAGNVSITVTAIGLGLMIFGIVLGIILKACAKKRAAKAAASVAAEEEPVAVVAAPADAPAAVEDAPAEEAPAEEVASEEVASEEVASEEAPAEEVPAEAEEAEAPLAEVTE